MSMIIDILESFLGTCRGHNSSSGQAQFDCPRCSEESGHYDGNGKGHLEINYERGWYNCWSCGKSHDMRGFLPYLIRTRGNQKILNHFLLIKPEFIDEKQDAIAKKIKLPEGFTPLHGCNPKKYGYEEAMGYLRGRNVTDDVIRKYNIGYTMVGKYAKRIIIPSYDLGGNINFFIGRAFTTKSFPKVLNEKAEKQTLVFNLKYINWDSTIYLVEGPFDHVITPNSIPLLGKFLYDFLKWTLFENAKGDIVIALDGDAYEDALIIYDKLNIGHLKGRIKVVKFHPDYDPSLINQKFGRKAYLKALGSARYNPE